MDFQLHVYQPIGQYEVKRDQSARERPSAGMQIDRSAGSADRDISAWVHRNWLRC
jgi:hypothetical protein